MNITPFNSNIFKSKLYYDGKNELIKKIKDEYKKYPNQTPKNWMCNIHSSFGTDYKIPIELTKNIENKFNNFLSDYLNNMKIDGNYYISSIWYNVYGKDEFQEPHDHGNSLFSGCYYLNFNKKIHHPTIFYNPNYNIDYSKLENNSYFCFPVDCEEDDIIFFPSYLKHGTKGIINQNCDELRITISFNLNNTFLKDNDKIKNMLYFHYI